MTFIQGNIMMCFLLHLLLHVTIFFQCLKLLLQWNIFDANQSQFMQQYFEGFYVWASFCFLNHAKRTLILFIYCISITTRMCLCMRVNKMRVCTCSCKCDGQFLLTALILINQAAPAPCNITVYLYVAVEQCSAHAADL